MGEKLKDEMIAWLESCANAHQGPIRAALLCAWQCGRSEAAAEQLAAREKEMAQFKEELQRSANAAKV